MSIERGRAYFRALGIEDRVQEFDVSSATVELAAQALGVDGARIAKTLSFKTDESCMLILAAGDARIDNRKFKDRFHSECRFKRDTASGIPFSFAVSCFFALVLSFRVCYNDVKAVIL